MRTVLVCVESSRAGAKIAACAAHTGLTQEVTTVAGPAELFFELGRRKTDLVLADVAFTRPDPVRFTQTVRTHSPRTEVVLAGEPDPVMTAKVMAAGAEGLLCAPGESTDDMLVSIAKAIMFTAPAAEAAPEDIPRQRSALLGMHPSERELQVLRGMSEGKSNAEIGRDLFVSEDTVKTHAKRLYRKLGARDRAHAIAMAFRSGLIC
ncbi:response regulator transcription factor [Glycomyces halotolerans]